MNNNKKKTTRSTTAVEPRHLKVKEKDISLTKKYCITISIIKISSIHKFILKTKQILSQAHLKIIDSTFSFTEFLPAC